MAFIEPMHRNKPNITYLLTLWGGIAVGVWMIFGVGHDMCVFSEIGFWSSLYVFSLGGRPPKVLLLCRSWGACVPRRSQRLYQLEFWLLVGTTMLDRLWARGQTKCNTPLMLATSVFGRILLKTLLCDVLVEVQAGHLMAQWRGMHGSCLVPFVMLTPTILRGRVPSWLRWWLGV